MSRFIELPEEEKRNVFQAVSGAFQNNTGSV